MIKRFLLAATIALFAAQTAALFGQQNWFFELFTHYPHYYTAAATALILLTIGDRMWKTATVLTVIFAMNMPLLMPYLNLQNLTTAPNPNATELSILAENFYYRNTSFEDFRQLIANEDPDIFIVHEASSLWLTEADYYDNNYNYYSYTQKLGVPGIFIFSRIPGSFHEVPLGTHVGLEFVPDDTDLAILAVHPPAPISATYAAERNAQFEDLAVYAQESAHPVIAIGDYNCTPWSPYFQQLLASSGLHDTRLNFGFIPSWHAHNPLFVLPIDHALASPQLNITEFRTAEKTASDHRPILVKLSLP